MDADLATGINRDNALRARVRVSEWRVGLMRFVRRSVVDSRLISIVTVLALWSLGSLMSDPKILPGPWLVGERMLDILVGKGGLREPAYVHFGVTLARIAAAVVAIMIIGGMIGLLMGLRRRFEDLMENVITYWMTLPVLLVSLLSIFWFGFTEFATVFATVMVITPIAATNMWAGTKALNTDLTAMAQAFRVGRIQIIRRVVLPQLYPYLFATFRSVFGMSWKVVAMVEAFVLQAGVGYALSFWFERFRLDQVLAWVGLFVIFILVLEHGVIGPIESRLFRWRPQWTG